MAIAILLVVIFVALIGFLYGGLSGAPWVPTQAKDIDRILKDAGVKPGDSFIELGSGDGRVIMAAAKAGGRATGYEINPLLWFVSWLKLRRYKHATVRLGNFWSCDLTEADVVMTFLIPRTMPRLASKVKKEMKPGSKLISYAFDLPGVKPTIVRKGWRIYEF